jgi:hypothetical protein
MSISRKCTVPALAVALATVALPVAAQGQGQTDPNARATFGKIKRVGKAKATLKVTYNCASGEALWVSAKQSKSGHRRAALRKEGSSKVAAVWWQSHRNPFICNGAPHTAKVTIDKVEPGSKGKLKKGKAWVQFCVTEGQETLVLSKSAWVNVVR